MSSNNGNSDRPEELTALLGRKRWSLAARLTAWYACSAFALVLTATSLLYFASVRNFNIEDDQMLGVHVRELRAVMVQSPNDMDALKRELDEEWEAHERRRAHIRIVGLDGKVAIETPNMSDTLPLSLFPATVAEPGLGVDVRSLASSQTDADAFPKIFRVMSVHARVGSPYTIQIAVDRTEIIRLLAEYRKNIYIVLGVSLILGTIVSYQIARRGLHPIYRIMKTTQRIRPSNLAERIPSDGLPAELLTLAGTFNQMLDRLEQSFNRLSRFSADIAHELRTPVNNIRCGIEVALTKPRTVEHYQDLLGSNLEECERLTRIIDSLLFLAQAENPRTQIQKEKVDLSVELTTVCNYFEAAACEKGVQLTAAVRDSLPIELNRSLFQRAVSNLVSNAIAHTPSGGSVTLQAARNGSSIKVDVVDTGCGIEPSDLPHIFDRFYRADKARSSTSGNVGLGLAIVKSIVELHCGTVDVESRVGQGTRIGITLPTTA